MINWGNKQSIPMCGTRVRARAAAAAATSAAATTSVAAAITAHGPRAAQPASKRAGARREKGRGGGRARVAPASRPRRVPVRLALCLPFAHPDERPRREDRGVEDDRLGVHHGEDEGEESAGECLGR